MSNKSIATIATMGIDIGKNSCVVGLDRRGAIVLRQKWSRGQIEARLVNMPPCLIGMEACVGAHHLSRKLQALGHDATHGRTIQMGQSPQIERIADTSARPPIASIRRQSGIDEKGHSTKSLRSSPLRGGVSREAGNKPRG